MNEQETCNAFVLPALDRADWSVDQIRPQFHINNGAISPTLKRHSVAHPLVADYVLEVSPDLPIGVVEAKRTRINAADGIEQRTGHPPPPPGCGGPARTPRRTRDRTSTQSTRVTLRYQDAAALRRALEDRLRQQSADLSHDLTRQRRLVVFDRLAARLSADPTSNWVLKGGAVLEFRLRDRARMTKDLDLATRLDHPDGDEVRDLLIDALSVDADGDRFIFRVARSTPLAPDTDDRPAWRFSVQALLAGRIFAGIRLDVAARGDELAHTEMLPLPNTLAFAGLPPEASRPWTGASTSPRSCTPSPATMATGPTPASRTSPISSC